MRQRTLHILAVFVLAVAIQAQPTAVLGRVGATHRVDPPVRLSELMTPFAHPGATYLSFELADIVLGVADRIVVQDTKSSVRTVVEGPLTAMRRWTTQVPHDDATIALQCVTPCRATVTRYARGLTAEEIKLQQVATATLQQCGKDDLQNAACYNPSRVYDASRAVARLVRGATACTGWLIGTEGHLLTNHHCVASQEQADSTTVEFGAEGASCGDMCRDWASCRGPVQIAGPRCIVADATLDYALLQVPAWLAQTYGNLRARIVPPAIGDRIYIPQHPAARGKHIAVISDQPDNGGFAQVWSTTARSCVGTTLRRDIGYYADTDTGSSGAPVITHADHRVVALHQCPGCPNTGITITAILDDLRRRGIAIPHATDD